jgi:hypothetical protein
VSKRELTFRDHLKAAADHGHSLPEVFRGFVHLAACAVSGSQREPEYLEEAKRWKPEQLQSFSHALATLVDEMEDRPYADLVGRFYQEEAQSKGARDGGGEFYTPACISKLLAQLTVGDPPADRPMAEVLKERGISVSRMRATCIDVSRVACDMCFLNLSLWGIPAQIVHGNSLSLEVWGSWRTFFWYEACGEAGEIAPSAPIDVQAAAAVQQAAQTSTGQLLFDMEAAV